MCNWDYNSPNLKPGKHISALIKAVSAFKRKEVLTISENRLREEMIQFFKRLIYLINRTICTIKACCTSAWLDQSFGIELREYIITCRAGNFRMASIDTHPQKIALVLASHTCWLVFLYSSLRTLRHVRRGILISLQLGKRPGN